MPGTHNKLSSLPQYEWESKVRNWQSNVIDKLLEAEKAFPCFTCKDEADNFKSSSVRIWSGK